MHLYRFNGYVVEKRFPSGQLFTPPTYFLEKWYFGDVEITQHSIKEKLLDKLGLEELKKTQRKFKFETAGKFHLLEDYGTKLGEEYIDLLENGKEILYKLHTSEEPKDSHECNHFGTTFTPLKKGCYGSRICRPFNEEELSKINKQTSLILSRDEREKIDFYDIHYSHMGAELFPFTVPTTYYFSK